MKANWKRQTPEKIKELVNNLKQAVETLATSTTERANRMLEMKKAIQVKGKIEQWKREREGK